ncbi:transcriptional regulator [Pseudomonas putida]|nr:transcriptional regulator [Pseudomonas putida]
MFLRFAFALLVFVSLPLVAAERELPTAKEVMKKHQAEIQNDLGNVDYNRKRVVEANMELEGEENELFWPIYNTYRAEADKLNKKTLEIMIDYGQAYNKGYVTDELATDLLGRVYALQEDQIKLRERYTRRFADKVSPKRAMRFLQIETQLDAITTLDIGRKLPLAD